jgi:methionyl-tRNA synthetase
VIASGTTRLAIFTPSGQLSNRETGLEGIQSSPMTTTPAYITTPIYYVNDKPHIGHVYTTTVCDVWARFMRLAGRDVFFLTGTDEHGVKIEKAAESRQIPPQQLVDENAALFQALLERFHFTNNDFIRTTQPRHVAQVQTIVQRLIDQGDVYLADYEGWYDEGQEEFIPENRAKDQDYVSAISGKPLVRMKESNYFFRLSAYQERLERLYTDQPDIVRPDARRNEMLGRLREGLQDIPVSRTSFRWGIKVPGADDHVLWVWLDALSNYITTIGLIDQDSDAYRDRRKYWPPQFHVVGKEILFFHALFWPAVLMALDLPLPRCIYAHSFWISEGQKMSKTLGNFIDLASIDRYLEAYGLDVWRYFLSTQGPLGATDADFAASHFHDVYMTDLVNTVGNCASRVTAMINKYFDGTVPDLSTPDNPRIADHDWPAIAADAVATAAHAMEQFDLPSAARAALDLIRRVDAFINLTEPFKLAKEESRRDELAAILYACAEAVRIASLLLWPIMPGKMAELWDALGQSVDPDTDHLPGLAAWGGLTPGTAIRKVALFPRMEQPDLAAAVS